ncbi:MAG: MATE family efflux transporter [Eubacteriales bacterium]
MEKTGTDKFVRMTTEPVERLICKMAAPTIVTMLISSIYNMADTYFIGQIKIDATASTGAVGVVFSFMAIIQAIGFFFGHGSGNYISRQLGDGKREDAVIMASTAFFSSLAAGIVLAAAGLIFCAPLAAALGSTESILPYAVSYLRYILIGTPFIMGSFVINNQLRFQGSAFYGMIGMTSGGILNVILDPIFIFGLDMGVAGAGCATMISQMVSFVILCFMCGRGENIRISPRSFKPTLQRYYEIVRGGFPSLARQGLSSVATIMLNFLASGWGDAAIAAMSIVSRITMFAASALIGFGQGFQPVCGWNYGARLYERVRRAFWFSVKVTAIFLLAAAAVGFIFSPSIIALFRRDDAEVIRIGTFALRAQCVTIPLSSFIVMANMYLQTIGKAIPATAVAMSRQFIFFVPALLIMTPVFGLAGIQLAQPVSDICSMILAVPVTLRVLSAMKNADEAQTAENIR